VTRHVTRTSLTRLPGSLRAAEAALSFCTAAVSSVVPPVFPSIGDRLRRRARRRRVRDSVRRSASVAHSIKRPLENRVWYRYPGQSTDPQGVGSWVQPAAVARVLDDGTSQISATSYNDHDLVTSMTDPLGRQTTYAYARERHRCRDLGLRCLGPRDQ